MSNIEFCIDEDIQPRSKTMIVQSRTIMRNSNVDPGVSKEFSLNERLNLLYRLKKHRFMHNSLRTHFSEFELMKLCNLLELELTINIRELGRIPICNFCDELNRII